MPITIVAGNVVDFTNTSSASFTSFLWDFGDGNTSTSENPSNTYSSAGTYVVTLTATSSLGSVSFSDTVTVTAATSVAFSTPSPAYAVFSAEDPKVMLRFSNDGGKTWSNERWERAGKIGEYSVRVHFHRLGAGRRRVFEVVMADPAPWKLTGCWIDTEAASA